MMATYQRDNLFIVTSAEELPSGRYRGFVTLTTEGSKSERRTCSACRDNALDAHADADADVEYVYRHYLAEQLKVVATGVLPSIERPDATIFP